MFRHIKNSTEEETHRQLGNDEWSSTLDELDALISILYARGTYGANNLDLDSVWGPLFEAHLFSAILRQKIVSENLCNFCDSTKKTTRSERLQTDTFCSISEVLKKFIENSITCCKPEPYITIDEQLFPSKARCRFTQNMPSKPDKFGIRF
ncbi:piggyBac transposable element-derived protein 4 [Trichonephila clavipes]|nr:piggyBac transposable element-derived protein 4 [Trichonephila clavipes]